MSEIELPAIEELIPHRGESILLDRVIAHDRESTTAREHDGQGDRRK